MPISKTPLLDKLTPEKRKEVVDLLAHTVMGKYLRKEIDQMKAGQTAEPTSDLKDNPKQS